MARYDKKLGLIIASNIRACRMARFPGRGGAKKCAEAFGVSPQQWSPWERGARTPSEEKLRQIAAFFGVTEEYLRTSRETSPADASQQSIRETSSLPGTDTSSPRDSVSLSQNNPLPEWVRALPSLRHCTPGSAESFYWLAERFLEALQGGGVKITIEPKIISYLCELLLPKKNEETPGV